MGCGRRRCTAVWRLRHIMWCVWPAAGRQAVYSCSVEASSVAGFDRCDVQRGGGWDLRHGVKHKRNLQGISLYKSKLAHCLGVVSCSVGPDTQDAASQLGTLWSCSSQRGFRCQLSTISLALCSLGWSHPSSKPYLSAQICRSATASSRCEWSGHRWHSRSRGAPGGTALSGCSPGAPAGGTDTACTTTGMAGFRDAQQRQESAQSFVFESRQTAGLR